MQCEVCGITQAETWPATDYIMYHLEYEQYICFDCEEEAAELRKQ